MSELVGGEGQYKGQYNLALMPAELKIRIGNFNKPYPDFAIAILGRAENKIIEVKNV